MRIRSVTIVVAAFIVTAVATPALAMYHPGMGRFMQRDPHGTMNAPAVPRIGMGGPSAAGGFVARDPMTARPQPGLQYADGMNLYQYCQSSPTIRRDPYGLSATKEHIEQMRCCVCLTIGEAEGESQQCKRAVIHVMRNRQALGRPKWPSFRREASFCGQSSMRRVFEGGAGNDRYDKCYDNFFKCPQEDVNPAEKRAYEQATEECELANDGASPDPTGGVQYFFAKGHTPPYMLKAVKIGLCQQVNLNCGNVFYRCNREPLASDVEGVRLP